MASSKVKNPKKTTSSIQAFRADPDVTRRLNRLPNKTEFIIDALEKAFSEREYVICSQCKGVGKIYKRKKKRRR